MTTQQLRAVATGKTAVAERPKDLAALMASANVQAQIRMALPRHMTAERLARIATTEMRRIPKLAECSPISFLGAVIQCAQLGLEPGGALGHVYLIPFGKEVQVIVGYRGFIDLARRSGQIVSIEARAVYEGDKFDCVLGLDSTIEHVPDWQNANRADPEKLRFVYAVAKLKGGGLQFDIMSRAEVDGIRRRSKSSGNGPWVTDYSAMALKTVVRRLFKFLPVSIEIQQAVGMDEMADIEISQQNGAILDGQFTEVRDDPLQVGDATPISGEEVNAPDHIADADKKIDPPVVEERAAPTATFAEVNDAMQKAKTLDELDEAAGLIPAVASRGHQKELNAAYGARRAVLGGEA